MSYNDITKKARFKWGSTPQNLVATFQNWKRKTPKIIHYSYVSDIPTDIDAYPWSIDFEPIVYKLVKIQELDNFLREQAKILKMKAQDRQRIAEYKKTKKGLRIHI